MSQVFRAQYFDGVQARPTEAFVQLTAQQLVVQVITADGEQSRLYWRKEACEVETRNNAVTVCFAPNPVQHVLIRDDAAADILADWKQSPVARSWYNLPMSVRIALLVVAIIGAVFSLYRWVLPWTAELAIHNVSVETEMEWGAVIATSFSDRYREYERHSEWLSQYAQRLTPDSPYRFRVHLVEEPELNACAFPGGQIFLFSGLYNQLQSQDELAALLGHEIAHVTERHSLRAFARMFSDMVLISMLTGQSSLGNMAASQAQQFLAMRHSRKRERQADERGLEMVCSVGLNAEGYTRLFERLQSAETDLSIALLRSHPAPGDRIEYLQSLETKLCSAEPAPDPVLDSLFVLMQSLSPEEDTVVTTED